MIPYALRRRQDLNLQTRYSTRSCIRPASVCKCLPWDTSLRGAGSPVVLPLRLSYDLGSDATQALRTRSTDLPIEIGSSLPRVRSFQRPFLGGDYDGQPPTLYPDFSALEVRLCRGSHALSLWAIRRCSPSCRSYYRSVFRPACTEGSDPASNMLCRMRSATSRP